MAMVELSKRAEIGPRMRLMDIANSQNLSLAYLEQLFMKLGRAGLVSGVSGLHGGYRLARPANEISLAEIMLAVDENVRMTRCSDDGGELCMSSQRCETHDLWQALGDHIGGFLSVITLQDVVDGTFLRALTAARLQIGGKVKAKAAASRKASDSRIQNR